MFRGITYIVHHVDSQPLSNAPQFCNVVCTFLNTVHLFVQHHLYKVSHLTIPILIGDLMQVVKILQTHQLSPHL
jgi:hypothetical protein